MRKIKSTGEIYKPQDTKTKPFPFSPHIHAPVSIKSFMWGVVLGLIPPVIASIYFFGLSALKTLLVSVSFSVLTELVINLISKKKLTIGDGSAVVTGILLALVLSPILPWYMTAVGAIFAIAIAKWPYGGLGRNIVNPALMARIFLLIAWSGFMVGYWKVPIPQMSKYLSHTEIKEEKIETITSATPLKSIQSRFGIDVVTSATPLTLIREQPGKEKMYSYWDMFVGNIPGCMGETSKLALILGFLIMLGTWMIRLKLPLHFYLSFLIIPTSYILTVAVFSLIAGVDPLFHILSGGLMIGALFMATDFVTTPMTDKGKLVFGIGAGIITMLIRLWGGYPEGVSFAIVLMNLLTPLIDRYL